MMSDSPITDEQLDRLVDGETSDEEYRRLLESLDDEPAGWRRCALAFLEAQSLYRDLIGLAHSREGEAPAEPHSGSVISSAGASLSHHSRTRLWPLVLAMSACFLIAFSIGALIPGAWLGAFGDVDGPARIAAGPVDSGTPDGADAARDEDSTDLEVADTTAPRDRLAPPEIAAHQTPSSDNTMIIELRDGEQMRRTEVPYYPWDEYTAASLQDDAPFPSPDFVRAVRRMGHDLRQRRQFLPVQLENGSRVIVPMEELEITPASNRGYQ
jgi:hypothetical protein